MTSPNRPNEPSPPGVNGRLSTSFSWISTWQNLIKLFATADAPSNSTLVRLEALEERVLYNASPLLALAPDFGTAHEHQIDIQLDELSELCFEAVCDYPSMVSEDFSLDAHSFDDGFPLVTTLDEQQLEEYELNRQLIVIDVRIDGFEDLISDITLQGNKQIAYDVLTLDDSTSGIGRISRYLEMGQAYEAIHIVAHGGDDRVQLGNVELTSELLHKYKDEIAGWASGLASDADILFYGCEVAASEQGRLLVDQIGQFTGADIAASDDLTGSAELGGDWDFEYFVGTVEAELAFSLDVQANWTGLLNTESVSEQAVANYITVPLTFEQNDGQVDAEVDFLARGSGYTVFLSDGDAELSLSNGETDYAVRLHLEGSNSTAAVAGQDELASRTNYLVGDSSEWLTDVGNFGRVLYSDIYDGIDVAYYGNQRQLEYDFIVNPGASVGEIQLSFEGAHSLSIAAAGELVITLNAVGDEVRFQAPYSYQDTADGRQLVESKYVIHADGTVGFEVGDYDASQTLVIDPILDYSTVLGGTGNETAFRITEDGAGNVYVLGNTRSTDFPATTGSLSGSSDIYIAKLSPDGSGASDLVYATYIGGSGNEYGAGGIHVNGAGEVIFLGSTESADFATTAGAYDTSLGGSADAVIGKLNAAGNSLLYSTYYGGNAGSEAAGAMAVDSSGNVYITGQTLSNNLPTLNAYDASFTGSSDIYVAKFNLAGGGSSDLLYSTYLGGNTDYERSSGIDVDGAGKVYITGPAFSGHPTTAGAFQTTMEGSSDAFLTVLDTTVSGSGGLVYSTYIGGAGSEQANDVYYRATDGYVYLAGRTSSTDFDTTTGAYMETSGGGWDGFLAIINPVSGGSSDLIYSTYLGGAGTDYVEGLDVDSSGIAYISGYTAGGMPLVNPTQGTFGGGTYDAFVATVNPAGSGSTDLTFSTFLGGSGIEYGHDIVVDSAGNFYVTGYTASADLPTTSGAYDETSNGGNDAFVAKFVGSAMPVANDDSYAVNENSTLAVDWWNTDWTRRQTLTFDNSLQGQNLDDFPVLVVLNSGNVNYGQIQNQGQDLRFFDADGTALSYEIEQWNESGDSYVWVRVPRIDASSTTDSITMYYGNATASAGQDASATWASNYSAVYHLNEDPTTTGGVIDDATWNTLDGVNMGSVDVVGTIGNAQSFDGTDDWVDLGSGSYIDGAGNVTISAWINPDTVSNNEQVVSASVGGAGPTINSRVGIERTSDEIKVYARSSDAENQQLVTTTSLNLTPGVWRHVTGVVDYATDTILIYVDGVLQATTGTVNFVDPTTTNSPSANASLGAQDDGSTNYFEGDLDEIRIETGARSVEWIRAQHKSMTNNSFVSFGGAETAPATGGVLTNDTDADGDTLTVSLVTGPTNAASFTLKPDGTFSYTPTGGYSGPDSFTYNVNDGTTDSNVATVAITVSASNNVHFTISSTPSISEDLAETATYTVTLGGDALVGGDTASVDITASGSALSGTDYDNFITAIATAAGSTAGVTFDGVDTLTFDSTFNGGTGQGAFVFAVDAIDDASVEGTETILATLSNPSVTGGSATFGIFSDSFTEASNTPITAHIPDSGLVWTKVFDDSTYGEAFVDAALGVVQGGSGASQNDTGQAYAAGPAPTSVNQTISFTLSAIETDNGTKPVGLFGRSADNDNFYYLRILPNDNAQDSISLWKMAGGVPTQLDTIDVAIAAGDTFKLEITDGAKKAYHNGTEVLTSTDNALTSAGTWGFFIGDFNGVGGHYRETWNIDDFLAEDSSSVVAASTDITETDVNNAPVESTIEGTNIAYTENDPATQITNTIAIADVDDTNIESAVVQITGNYANGEDILAFANTGTITGVWSAVSGTMTLTGSDTLANYEAALRSITYQDTSEEPSGLTRTVSFSVNDGSLNSNTLTRDIDVARVNDAPTFSAGTGSTVTDIGTSTDGAMDLIEQPDGKYLVAGYGAVGGNFDFTLVRYNEDGTIDSAFGTDGVVTTALTPSGSDVGQSVGLQSDGKILVAGYDGNYDFALVRYNSDGSLDSSFGTGGVVATSIGSFDFGRSVAVQSDGKIVVAGTTDAGANRDFAVVRYDTDGSLDTSFGSGGIAIVDIGIGDDQGYDVAIQADGKLLVTGSGNNGTDDDIALVRFNTDGSLDTGFGSGGIVTTDFGGTTDLGYSSVIQPDGKIVVAGWSNDGQYDFALARYNADGSLDASFGSAGTVTTSIGLGDDRGFDVWLQADGKILVTGRSDMGSSYDFATVRYNPDGSLDASFGSGGILTSDLNGLADYGYAVMQKSDGTILVAGHTYAGVTSDFGLVRYNADGSLYENFNPVNTLDGSPTFIEGGAPVVLDADVQVFDQELSPSDAFSGATLTLARNGGANAEDAYSATGNLSTLTQGGNLILSGVTVGTVTTNSTGTLLLTFNSNATQARVDEVMQSIAYSNSSNTPPATAQIDWSFSDGNSGAQGSGGALTADGSTTVSITAVNDPPSVNTTPSTLGYVENDGPVAVDSGLTLSDPDSSTIVSATVRIIVGLIPGEDQLDFTDQLGITGSYDSGTGILTLSGAASVADYETALRSVTYENSSDNPNTTSRNVSFTVNDGASISSSNRLMSVTAVNDAPSFTDDSAAPGDDGIVTTDIAASDDNVFGMTVQPDGKVLVAGQSGTGSGSDFALLRYHPNGSLDTSFGFGGMVITDIAGAADLGFDVTVQPDGKILISGQTYNGTDYDFAVMRYNSDGSLDVSFGTGGIVTTDFGGLDEFGKDITVQADGKILVAGLHFNGTDYDFALARYNNDGSLDASFGTGGWVTTGIGGDDRAIGIAVQADGKILVSGDSFNGANTDFALVRYNADGSLDASFGAGGKVITDFGLSIDEGVRFALQPDGKILLAGSSSNGTDDDFALARYNTDGSLDGTFGSSGLVTTPIGTGDDLAYNVAVQADGKIVVSGESDNGSDDDFAVVRYNSDGTLDSSFGSGGIVTTPVGAGTDKARAFALQSDGKILLAGLSNNGSDNDIGVVRYNTDGTLDTTFDATNTLDGNPTFVEGGAAVILDADVNVFDAELRAANNYDGATLTILRNGGANADDVFSTAGNLVFSAGNLVLSGITVGTVDTNSGGTLQLTFNTNATQASINETLQSIAYSNSSDAPPANVQLDWTFDDGNTGVQGSGGALNTVGSTVVQITAVNDAPVNFAIGPKTVVEEVPTAVSGLSISDVDAGGGLLTTRLVVSDGALNVTLVGGAAISAGINDSVDLTIEGTVADINATLATLTYTGNSDVAGTAADTLSVITNDGGNTGTGGPNTTVNFVQIDITPVNDAPQATNLNASDSYTEETLLNLTDIVVSDVDDTDVTVTLTLSDIGAGSLSTGTSGAVTSTFASGVWTASGLIADVNSLLAGVTFTPTGDYAGDFTITTSVDDGEAAPVTGFKNVTATPVNDAPVLLSGAINNLVVLEDSGLTSLGLSGVTFGPGGGADESSQTLTYEVTVIPSPVFGDIYLADGLTKVTTTTYTLAELQGMQFRPADDAAGGPSFFQFRISDDGGTANGGSDYISPAIQLNITPQNDAPLLTLTGSTLNYTENDGPVAVDGALTVTDVDDTDLTGATVRILAGFDSGEDTLGFVDQLGITGSYNAGTGILTLSGTASVTDYQTALRSVTYQNSSEDPSTANRTVSFQVTDGTAISNSTRTVSVAAINDSPTLATTTSTPTLTENGGPIGLFSGTSVDLIEAGDVVDTLVVTVDSLANGSDEILIVDGQSIELTHLNVATTAANGYDVNVSLSGSTATVTITKLGGYVATAAETLVDGLTYNNTSENPLGPTRVVTLTYLKDDGGTVAGGDDDAVLSFASLVSVNPVNDAPINSMAMIPGQTVTTSADGAASIATGDFDGDGDIDFVSASILDNTIAWYENDGSPSPGFAVNNISTSALGARFVSVADVDGDLDLDILAASTDDNTIAWYENDGLGGFTQQVVTASAIGATSVYAADMDGDSDIDIVTSSYLDDTIAWYENDGSQNFSLNTIDVAANGAWMIHLADVDSDLDMDVVAVNWFDSEVAWYENDGAANPTFSKQAVSVTTNGASSVYADDVDGDGDVDILATSFFNDTISLFINDGSEVFTEQILTTQADGARQAIMADMDGDGDQDIIGAASNSGEVLWFENDGAPTPTFEQFTLSSGNPGPLAVAVADVDNDGTLDVLTANFNDDAVDLYENESGQLAAVVTNEDTPLVFNAANGNLISISDIDANNGTMSMAITVDIGTLTLSGTTGLLFTTGDGTADPLMVFTGTVADVNAALDGLVYNPPLDFNGDAKLTLITGDQGNTGGGALADSDSLKITVLPVNDEPVGFDNTVITNEDTDYVFGTGDFSWADIEGDNLAAVQITTLPAVGTLYLDLNGDGLVGGGEAISASDVITMVDIDAGRLRFKPVANANGTGYTSFTFQVRDDGGTSNGGVDTDSTPNTMTIDVTPVNDEQLIATNTGITLLEGSSGNVVTTAMLETTDVDHTAAQLTYTITAVPISGFVKRLGVNLAVSSTFTQADIDTGFITYLHDGSETVADSYSFSVDDGTGSSSSGTFNITITPVNDNAPVFTTPSAVNVVENTTPVMTVNATDADQPGQTVTYTISGGLDSTLFSIDANTGDLTFNAPPDFETPGDSNSDNVYEVEVTADDNVSLTTAQTILITVSDDNDSPVITTTTFNSAENQTSIGTLLASDDDGDVPTYTITGGSDQTDFNLTPAGVLTFNTAQDFENPADTDTDGVYEVQVTANDGNGGTDVRTILITVTDGNDAPIITTSTFNAAENQTSVGTLLASDQDGDVPTYTITGGADQTDFNLTPAGVLTFNTAQDFENPTDADTDGVYEVQVTANDGNGGTDVRTILVTFTDANDAPVITTTTFSSAENQTSVGNLLASDDDGDVPTYTITGGADQTDFNLTPAGVLTFNTAQDFENPTDADTDGVYEVQVTANDGNGGTDVRTILITVTDANDAPVISTTTFNSAENQTSVGNLLASDDDGDVPTYTITGGADQTEFNLTPAGVLTFNTAQDFENPTDADTDGVYEVQVTANDGNGGTDVRTILITVTDDNDAPLITTSTFNAAENQASIGNMLASDQDGDIPTYTITGGADQTDFNLTPAGVLTFNTAQDFENPTDADTDGVYEVQVTANDGNAGADFRTILVTVTDGNDAPIITTSTFNATENQASIGNMLASDQDGDVPTYTITGGADQTDFNLTLAGVLTFNTAQDFENPTDADTDGVYEVQVTANDGNGGTDVRTILVTVTDGNDAPVITTSTFNAAENQTSIGNMLASDQDGDIPTYTITGGADQTDFNLTPAGVLTFNTAQDFENPTDADTDGVYEVQVTANDGNGGTDVRTILVTVTDANDAPVITTTTFNSAENQTSIGNLLASDDDGDVATYTITGGADQADFNLTPAGVLTFNTAQDFENPADADTDGVYEVQVTANDGNGGTDVRTILVTVTDGNDAPIITTSTFNAAENQTSVGTLLASDQDGDVPTYTITGGADQTDFNLTPAGVLTFNTAQDFENPTDANTDGVYEVQVTANDGNGGTDVRTILVTITDGNDAPLITSDGGGTSASISVVENATAVTNVISNDPDLPPNTLTYAITGGADSADFAINSSTGELTFVSGKDFETPSDANLDGTYEVQITVDDGNGGTDIQTISVTVTDVNEAPVANPDSTTVVEGGTVNVMVPGVTANDTDDDADALTVSLVSGPTNGSLTLNPDGSFSYTHDGSETTVDSFVYQVADGKGGFDTQTVAIAVTPVNDAPSANAEVYSIAEDTTLNSPFDVLANDTDAEADALTISLIDPPDHADFFVLNPSGSFNYVPSPEFNGVDTFTYQIDDGNGGVDSATVTITITPVNDTPVGSTDSYTTSVETTINAIVSVLSNDSDVEGDPLSAILLSGPVNGTLSLAPNGTFAYTPDAGFVGVDSFSYIPNDGMINGVATLVNIEVVVGTNKDIDIDKSKEPPDEEPQKEPESKTETKKTVEPDLADKLATDPLFDGAVLRLGTISDFDGGVDSLFQLLANRQQAEDVLNIMLQNVDADLLDEDDGKRRVDTGLSTAFDPKYLWHDLDSLNDLQRKLFEQMNISIGAVTAVSTLGYILWSLRGGVLIAAAITQMPNWRLIDPLPVLENYETKAGSSKGDELNSFFDRN